LELVNLDSLEKWIVPPEDPEAVDRAERAAQEEGARLATWWSGRAVEGTVALLRKRAEALRRDELEAAYRRLVGFSAKERAVVDKMTERLVNRLLHGPTEKIRTEGPRDRKAFERLVRDLFELEA
jgi:glutamyl-tRNA reductase